MISSLKHPLVKHLVDLKRDRHIREQEQSLLFEGKNAIIDLCRNGKIQIKRLIVESEEILPEDLHADEVIRVSRGIIEKISSVENPENCIAEITMPKMQDLSKKSHIIVCDSIQDPGNLGTIIRTATAFGWDGIFLLEPCCDPFNDKALRASKGATFELPIQKGAWSDLSRFDHLKLIADMEGDAPERYPADQKLLLIVGNEAKGVRPPADFPHQKIAIPMSGPMESLNVAIAAGILLYTLRPS
ncbi:MAG: hypothetical protein JWO53_682 [Chlamydiia bacterium]|nr:hypothetical protein [Chlamydiia bacterium]